MPVRLWKLWRGLVGAGIFIIEDVFWQSATVQFCLFTGGVVVGQGNGRLVLAIVAVNATQTVRGNGASGRFCSGWFLRLVCWADVF